MIGCELTPITSVILCGGSGKQRGMDCRASLAMTAPFRHREAQHRHREAAGRGDPWALDCRAPLAMTGLPATLMSGAPEHAQH